MLRRMFEVGLTIALLVSSGCAGVSRNMERSLLRGTGDGGITTVLDNQDADKVQEVADGVKDICNDVLNFLDSGNIAELTKGELKAALLDVVPGGSADFVSDIIGLVSVTNVDTSQIGTRNVKRIRALVKGVINGANEYAAGDR